MVGGCDPGLDMVVSDPDQSLQVAGRLVDRPQSPQAVAIGSQVVGEAVAVTGVGLCARDAPARAGGVEGVGVNRDDRVAGFKQTLDH